MSVSVPMLGVGETRRCELLPQLEGPTLLHVAEQQILRVGHADLAEAVAIRQIGDQVHLGIGDIARRYPGLLQRDVYRAIAGHLVRGGVVAVPGAKGGFCSRSRASYRTARGRRAALKMPPHARHLGIVDESVSVPHQLPFRFHAPPKFLDPERAHQNLDARLVHDCRACPPGCRPAVLPRGTTADARAARTPAPPGR